MHCRMFMSIPGLYPLDACSEHTPAPIVASKNVCRHCQNGGTKSPPAGNHTFQRYSMHAQTQGCVPLLISPPPHCGTQLLSNSLGHLYRGDGQPVPRRDATATHQVPDELIHQLLPAAGSLAGRRGAGTARRLLPLGPGRPRRRGPPRALQKALGQRQVPRGLLLAAPRDHLGPPRPSLGSLGPPPLPQRLGLRQLLLPVPAELVQTVVGHRRRSRPAASPSAHQVPRDGPSAGSVRRHRKPPPLPRSGSGWPARPRPAPSAPLRLSLALWLAATQAEVCALPPPPAFQLSACGFCQAQSVRQALFFHSNMH